VFGLITIGEYTAWRSFDTFLALRALAGLASGPITPRLRAVVSLSFGEWDRITREPPKPGRAGIIAREGDRTLMKTIAWRESD